MENELNETGSSFIDSLSLQQQSLFSYGHRSLLGDSPGNKRRVRMINAMHQDALRDLADPSLNLVFLHLPLPHAPYIYDGSSHTFPKRYLSVGTYLDNLALTDTFLGDFRDALTKAGLWEKTTLVVSSDHPNRRSREVDGKDDPRVPFLLKMAGQTTGVVYEPKLLTIVTKSLIEAILNREITTSEEAVKWLPTHPR
jgi:arylsulfatase A-like enzyme